MIKATKEKELQERYQEESYSNPIVPASFGMSSFGAPPPPRSSFGAPGGGGEGGGARGGGREVQRRLGSVRSLARGPQETDSYSAPPTRSMAKSRAPIMESAAPPAAPPTSTSATTRVEKHAGTAPTDHSPKPYLPGNALTTDDGDVGAKDYTKIPAVLDARFEEYGKGNVIRPTIVHLSNVWSKKSQKSLLSKMEDSTIDEDIQRSEKTKAFDLLDALTKSGALTVDHASLHVVMAATHCFDKTLMDTVIQDNVNPIEKVEKSILIMAATVHDRCVSELVTSDNLDRISNTSPLLVSGLLSI